MKCSSNICFGYLLDSPEWGDFNKYPKHNLHIAGISFSLGVIQPILVSWVVFCAALRTSMLSYELSQWNCPASILYKSTAGRCRPVSYPDGPITARCRFIKNAYWVRFLSSFTYAFLVPRAAFTEFIWLMLYLRVAIKRFPVLHHNGFFISSPEPKAHKMSLWYTSGPLSVVVRPYTQTSQKPLNRLKTDFIWHIYASREQKFI